MLMQLTFPHSLLYRLKALDIEIEKRKKSPLRKFVDSCETQTEKRQVLRKADIHFSVKHYYSDN